VIAQRKLICRGWNPLRERAAPQVLRRWSHDRPGLVPMQGHQTFYPGHCARVSSPSCRKPLNKKNRRLVNRPRRNEDASMHPSAAAWSAVWAWKTMCAFSSGPFQKVTIFCRSWRHGADLISEAQPHRVKSTPASLGWRRTEPVVQQWMLARAAS